MPYTYTAVLQALWNLLKLLLPLHEAENAAQGSEMARSTHLQVGLQECLGAYNACA